MAKFVSYADGSLDTAIRECLEIRAAIMRGEIKTHLGMATKSDIEDEAMRRHPGTTRYHWHQITNLMTHYNWTEAA